MNKTEVLLQKILSELQTMNENISQLAKAMKSNLSESKKSKKSKTSKLLVESKQEPEVDVHEVVQSILKSPVDKLIADYIGSDKEDTNKGKSR